MWEFNVFIVTDATCDGLSLGASHLETLISCFKKEATAGYEVEYSVGDSTAVIRGEGVQVSFHVRDVLSKGSFFCKKFEELCKPHSLDEIGGKSIFDIAFGFSEEDLDKAFVFFDTCCLEQIEARLVLEEAARDAYRNSNLVETIPRAIIGDQGHLLEATMRLLLNSERSEKRLADSKAASALAFNELANTFANTAGSRYNPVDAWLSYIFKVIAAELA